VTLELAESLLLSESVSPRAIARGLFLQATQQMPFVQALLVTGAVDEAKIEEALGPKVFPGLEAPLTTITPSLALVQKLPRGFCSRLLAVPLGIDSATGAVDLALVDPRDEHAINEAAFFLRTELHVHRATIWAIRSAIEQIHRADASLAAESPAHGERSRTPIWGTPVVSVVPQAAPHAGPFDMPIPLMRRSGTSAPPPAPRAPEARVVGPEREEESAVLELRTPASGRPARQTSTADEPDTEREPDPIFALKPSTLGVLTAGRRSVAVMIAETAITPKDPRSAAITVPAPPVPQAKTDPRHTMVTTPAPARRSDVPPAITMPRSQTGALSPPRVSGVRSMSPAMGGLTLPLPDASPVLAAMEEANDRDAIIALLLSGMRAFARRVAVMAVKRDAFLGWSCNAEFGDARVWRTVRVPSNVPSVLATAAAGTPYLGPLFRTDGHAPILAFMRETSRDVAVAGVRVDMHAALVLLADELADTALGTKRMEQLAKASGVALGRLMRKPQPGTKGS
jgi:hypothetical protein